MKLGGITPLDDALHGAFRSFGLQRKIKHGELFSCWKDIVGEAIAAQSKPQRLDDGTLWIHVPDAAWRQELSLMRTELMKKINDALEGDYIHRIIVR